MRKHPVVEVFGPTIQGEGPDAGRPCHFVRFGGCDFRCEWCDSMHAVEPRQVRKAERLTDMEIAVRLEALARGPSYVVLSGGNPALHELEDLVDALHERGFHVAVETQGSKWRDWLADVDRLVVSPKGPSSGMYTAKHLDQLDNFMGRVEAQMATPPLGSEAMYLAGQVSYERVALKVVIANDQDYRAAREWHACWPHIPFYLSAVSPVPGEATELDDAQMRNDVGLSYRYVCERVAGDAAMSDVKVLPQLHTIAWGARLGV
jgi:7-carboxy-7-deazaguanine synthase